jgi:SAM-dependent methyltransferase
VWSMTTPARFDAWSTAQSYERYMGRWSARIAARFVEWLDPPQDADWLEIGCGTGALTKTILAACAPRSLTAIDPSEDFIAHARSVIDDTRVRFAVTDAQNPPVDEASIDIVASALVVNFLPDRPSALARMRSVLKPNGLLAFYVWDYPGGGVGFIDRFWKAAAEVDERAGALDERRRFPFCTRDGLMAICREANFRSPVVAPIEIETVFPDFASFWEPFTLGAGPAPGYCMNLPEDHRAILKARLADMLGADGPIRLVARAWAAKARRPK